MGEKNSWRPSGKFFILYAVINLHATQPSGYCLIPASMILECLTTSRFRVPATHKDAAPYCSSAHKDHRSCAHD